MAFVRKNLVVHNPAQGLGPGMVFYVTTDALGSGSGEALEDGYFDDIATELAKWNYPLIAISRRHSTAASNVSVIVQPFLDGSEIKVRASKFSSA